MQVLKQLLSFLGFGRVREVLPVPDYSQLSPVELTNLYDEVCSTLIRYVDFAWGELQQPRPFFVVFQDRALAVETSHDLFLKHYGNYLGVLRELERCGIQSRPLSQKVLSAIEKLTADASTQERGVLLPTKS